MPGSTQVIYTRKVGRDVAPIQMALEDDLYAIIPQHDVSPDIIFATVPPQGVRYPHRVYVSGDRVYLANCLIVTPAPGVTHEEIDDVLQGYDHTFEDYGLIAHYRVYAEDPVTTCTEWSRDPRFSTVEVAFIEHLSGR